MQKLKDGSAIGVILQRAARVPWAILVIYPALWIALSSVSSEYWFLPAGLRVGALWLSPLRRWPWLAVAEWAAIAVVTSPTGSHIHFGAEVVSTLLPWLIYAAFVHELRRYADAWVEDGVAYWVPFTLLAGLAAGAANGLALTGLRWLDTGALYNPLETYIVFALGEYAGVVTLAPVLVLWAEQRRSPAGAAAYLHRGWVLLPSLGLGAALWMAGRFPPAYDWLLVAAPLLGVGATGGRRPACVSLMLLVLAFGLATALPSAWGPEDVQRIVVVSGSAAVLLGAHRDALTLQRVRLVNSFTELQLKTQALRDVANRMSSQREAESRQLGLELHDQVGQDMTALATRLRIAERTAVDDNTRQELRILKAMVETAQEHLQYVIRQLHPIALERFGLVRALVDGPLSEMAHDAGVRFECELTGPADALPLDVSAALYRISQEATTNGVRHGCGGEIRIVLHVGHARGTHSVSLAIFDRAGPITVATDRSGLGLQGIRDRAHALGATYRFDPDSGAPRHLVLMNVQGDADPPPAGSGARRRFRPHEISGTSPANFLRSVGSPTGDGRNC